MLIYSYSYKSTTNYAFRFVVDDRLVVSLIVAYLGLSRLLTYYYSSLMPLTGEVETNQKGRL